ncbi:MAG: M23 family metallopeptidase [Acidimicrobiia bacterium]|nr:M23 family metallopeptidase [Acidimicrobiia bacterium]
MRVIVRHLVLTASLASNIVTPCAALTPPVVGEIVQEFAPIGSYAGHWGIDFGVDVGTPALAAAAGHVTFAGSVAGMLSVTIDHGGGLKTSYSYLSNIKVSAGDRLRVGDIVGATGLHHGVASLHFSVRVDGVYEDPAAWLRCGGSIPNALWLAPA